MSSLLNYILLYTLHFGGVGVGEELLHNMLRGETGTFLHNLSEGRTILLFP